MLLFAISSASTVHLVNDCSFYAPDYDILYSIHELKAVPILVGPFIARLG